MKILYLLCFIPTVLSVRTTTEIHPDNSDILQLTSAVARGDINEVRKFIVSGSDLSRNDPFGYRLIHWAVHSGNKDIVALLLNQGNAFVDLNTEKLLLYTLFKGNYEITKLIFSKLNPVPRKSFYDTNYIILARRADKKYREDLIKVEYEKDVWRKNFQSFLSCSGLFELFHLFKSFLTVLVALKMGPPLKAPFTELIGVRELVFPLTPSCHASIGDLPIETSDGHFLFIFNTNFIDAIPIALAYIHPGIFGDLVNFISLQLFVICFRILISHLIKESVYDSAMGKFLDQFSEVDDKLKAFVDYTFPKMVQAEKVLAENCTICLEPLDQGEESEVVQWCCLKHQYHRACAQQLLNRNRVWCALCQGDLRDKLPLTE